MIRSFHKLAERRRMARRDHPPMRRALRSVCRLQERTSVLHGLSRARSVLLRRRGFALTQCGARIYPQPSQE